jgi:hypothetical protein
MSAGSGIVRADRGTPNSPRARAHHQRGTELFRRGDYRAALSEFQAAYTIGGDPELLFYFGECFRLLDEPAAAVISYRGYLRLQPRSPKRTEVELLIAKLEAAPRQPSSQPVDPYQCPRGRKITLDTKGHCCWPAQVWDGQLCIGVPSSCPEDFHVDPARQACVHQSCVEGTGLVDGEHCCFPGQAWSEERQVCVGVATRCPPGTVASLDTCRPKTALPRSQARLMRGTRGAVYVGLGVTRIQNVGENYQPADYRESFLFSLAIGLRHPLSPSWSVQSRLTLDVVPAADARDVGGEGKVDNRFHSLIGVIPEVTFRATPLSEASPWYVGFGARGGPGFVNRSNNPDAAIGILQGVLETGILIGGSEEWDINLRGAIGGNFGSDQGETRNGLAYQVLVVGGWAFR